MHAGEPDTREDAVPEVPSLPTLEQTDEPPVDDIEARMRELFDGEFYLSKYLDVARAKADPFAHYMEFGWLEDRLPAQDFDGAYYRRKHLSLAEVKMSPLEHYARVGEALGVPTNEKDDFFRFGDRDWTSLVLELLQFAGVQVSGLNKDIFQRFIYPMFSAEAYRARRGLPETVTNTEALARYLTFDFVNGLGPGPLFDDAVYREAIRKADLPPVEQTGGAYLHWLEHGIANEIIPTRLFSEEEYIRRVWNLDKSFSGWSFEHFVKVGQYQDLPFSPLFYMPPDENNEPPRFERPRTRKFLNWLDRTPSALSEMGANEAFIESGQLAELTSAAAELEPLIGAQLGLNFRLYPPWQDGEYLDFQEVRNLIPLETAKRIILMPFGKMGGSDYLTGVLANLAGDPSDTLILRTEEPDWAYPAWFPEAATTVDLSAALSKLKSPMRQRVLYELIRSLKAEHVYCCNSRVGFNTFAMYGARLATFTRLYAYFYCSDFDKDGTEAGYPVSHFSRVAPHVSAMLFDSNYWREKLADRFQLTEDLRNRMHSIYVPPKCDVPDVPMVTAQVETSEERQRPLILWAGRLDRQKRFDVVLDVARAMPDVDFACWGRPVLDPDEYDLSDLPANVTLHPPFAWIEDLPLSEADGWLYTSAWDGLPNMVIEVAACGIPMVASAVCGVPELIDDKTGWPVADGEAADSYVNALRDMLSDKDARVARATAAYERVKSRHVREEFAAAIEGVEGRTDG